MEIQRIIGEEEEKLYIFLNSICQPELMSEPLRISVMISILNNSYFPVVAERYCREFEENAEKKYKSEEKKLLIAHMTALRVAYMLDRLYRQMEKMKNSLQDYISSISAIDLEIRQRYVSIANKVQNLILNFLSSKNMGGLVKCRFEGSSFRQNNHSKANSEWEKVGSAYERNFNGERFIYAEIPLWLSNAFDDFDWDLPGVYKDMFPENGQKSFSIFRHFIKLFAGNFVESYRALCLIDESISELTSICPISRRSVLEFIIKENYPQIISPDLQDYLEKLSPDTLIKISDLSLLKDVNNLISPLNIFKRLKILLSMRIDSLSRVEYLINALRDVRRMISLLHKNQHPLLEKNRNNIARIGDEIDIIQGLGSVKIRDIVKVAIDSAELIHSISPHKDLEDSGVKIDPYNLEISFLPKDPAKENAQEQSDRYSKTVSVQSYMSQIERLRRQDGGENFPSNNRF